MKSDALFNRVRICVAEFLLYRLPRFRGKSRLFMALVPEEGWYRTTLGIRLRLSPRDYTSRRLIFGEDGNLAPFQFASSATSGGCFLDIGSNRGPYACIAGIAVGNQGMVVSVEPNPSLWQSLLANLHEHVSGQCMFVPAAISNSAGWLSFSVDNATHSGGGHLEKESSAGTGATCVPVQTVGAGIEPFLPSRPSEIRIKIDVEGAELIVLQGLVAILRRPECRDVLVEISPDALARFGGSESEVLELMAQAGFSPQVTEEQAGKLIQRDGYYDQWFKKSS